MKTWLINYNMEQRCNSLLRTASWQYYFATCCSCRRQAEAVTMYHADAGSEYLSVQNSGGPLPTPSTLQPSAPHSFVLAIPRHTFVLRNPRVSFLRLPSLARFCCSNPSKGSWLLVFLPEREPSAMCSICGLSSLPLTPDWTRAVIRTCCSQKRRKTRKMSM